METKYFVCIKPRETGSHLVHKEDCPFLPEPEKRIFLGIFKSSLSALEEGRKYCNIPSSCIFCSKENTPRNRILIHNEMLNDPHLISSGRVKYTWENFLVCSIN